MKLLNRLAAVVLPLLTVFLAVWVGIGVAVLWSEPARRSVETVLILGLFAGLAALCFWGVARLRR